MKHSEQLKHQGQNDVGESVVDKLVRFWLGLPGWKKLLVPQNFVQNVGFFNEWLLRNNFIDDDFNSTKVVVGAVNALRIYFGHHGSS